MQHTIFSKFQVRPIKTIFNLKLAIHFTNISFYTKYIYYLCFIQIIRGSLSRQITFHRKNHNDYVRIQEDGKGTKEIMLNHEKTRCIFQKLLNRVGMVFCKKTVVHSLITFSRNSLSLEMMTNLVNALKSNNDDPTLRAIVLAASGKIFSAGHNLKELVSKLLLYY